MTISLLRQIWQRIVDKQAPARQRLTGFESLEPRMVLSGFSAIMPDDYLSPPLGDHGYSERSGAQYSGLAGNETDYGRLSDFQTPGVGVSPFAEPRFVGFVNFGPIMTPGGMRDLVAVTKPVEGVVDLDGVFADSVFSSHSFTLSTINSSGGDVSFASSGLSVRLEFAPVSKSIVDHVMGDGESNWLAGSIANFDRFLSISSSSVSVGLGSPLNSVVVSGLVPSSLNAALEGRMEARAASVEGAGGAPRSAALDASLAHAVTSEGTTRSASSATAIAMLATQSDGLRSSSATGIADNSSNNGNEQGPTNPNAANEQDELDEAYAVGRRGMKRKLPGDVTALDETDGDDAELVQESGDGDILLLIESGRQFDPAGNSRSQIPEFALANLPVDGLIDVLAADVDSRAGDHKLLDTGRLALVEPVMMAYQAFEVIIDRNPQAEGRVADAADVATVAMAEHPVVTQ